MNGSVPDPNAAAELLAEADRIRRQCDELAGAGNYADAASGLEQAIQSTIDSDDEELATVARVLLAEKASLLRALGQHEGALHQYDRIGDSARRAAEPLRTQLEAYALNQRAQLLGELLRFDEAISAFDAVIDGFGDKPDHDTRVTVAGALFNKAIAVRETGRLDEALAAFDAVGDFTGGESDPELDQWAALALYNKAGLLVTLDDTDAALEVYEEVGTRFATSASDMAYERAARATRIRADRLADAGQTDDAIAGYRDTADRFADAALPAARAEAGLALLTLVVLHTNQQNVAPAIDILDEIERRFSADPDLAVRAVAEQARDLRAQIDGQLNTVSHAMADPSGQSRHNRLRESAARLALAALVLMVVAVVAVIAVLLLLPAGRLPVVGGIVAITVAFWLWLSRRVRAVSEYSRTNRAHMESEAKAQADLDEAARQVLADNVATGQPYALFLRSFEIESSRNLVDRDTGLEWVTFLTPNLGAIEKSLQTGLTRWVPLIGVHNPADTYTRFKGGIPRLTLPNEGWQETVRNLVARAELIVFQPAGRTPGVSAELSIIMDENRQRDTVVILAEQTHEAVAVRRVALAAAEVSIRDHDPLWIGSPEFASFPRVLADEVDVDVLDEHPKLADLIDGVRFLAALEPRERRQAHDARVQLRAGTAYLRAGEAGQALRVLNDTRHTQQRLDDRIGLIWTLLTIATIKQMVGDVAAATQLCEDALARCGDRDRVAAGMCRHLLAICQHEAGDIDAAIATLRLALDDLGVCGSRDGMLAAWDLLAELHFHAGDVEPTIELLSDAISLRRAVQDYVGLVDTLMNLGCAQLVFGRGDDAIATTTEALAVIRAAGGDPALDELEPPVLAVLAVASDRAGAVADAARYAAAARALPVSAHHAETVSSLLSSLERPPSGE